MCLVMIQGHVIDVWCKRTNQDWKRGHTLVELVYSNYIDIDKWKRVGPEMGGRADERFSAGRIRVPKPTAPSRYFRHDALLDSESLTAGKPATACLQAPIPEIQEIAEAVLAGQFVDLENRGDDADSGAAFSA